MKYFLWSFFPFHWFKKGSWYKDVYKCAGNLIKTQKKLLPLKFGKTNQTSVVQIWIWLWLNKALSNGHCQDKDCLRACAKCMDSHRPAHAESHKKNPERIFAPRIISGIDISVSIHSLTFTTLWAFSADDKLKIFFLLFPEYRIWHFMQIVS